MKNKKLVSILGLSAVMALGLAANLSSKTHTFAPAKADGESDILYSNDFSNAEQLADWGTDEATRPIKIENGKAVWTGNKNNAIFPIPASTWVESNNYEISFWAQNTSGADMYFHLRGLDGRAADQNIYLAFVAGGQYLRLANFNAGDIYDNSGADQGCDDWGYRTFTKFRDEGCEYKFVIFGDVIDAFVDGHRFLSTPLSAFGNNRYATRENIVKGILNGLMIDYRGGAGELLFDDVLIKEAKAGSTDIVVKNITGANYTLPLDSRNLYQPNFYAKGTFKVHNTLVTDGNIHAYPKMQFCMIHPATNSTDPTNNLIMQSYLDREFSTVWLGGKKADWNWGSSDLPYTAGQYGAEVIHNLEIEVTGDNIRIASWSNGNPDNYGEGATKRERTVSFEELGLVKGALVQIRLENEYTDFLSFEYHGYGSDKAINLSYGTTEIVKGDEITVNALLLGNAKTETGLVWYVDGEATEISEPVWTGSFAESGKHTLAYGKDGLMSSPVTFDVADQILRIAGDKTSAYKGETVTYTATKVGPFEEEVEWYVDGVAQLEKGDTFTYAPDGTKESVVIGAKCDGVECESTLTLTVKESEIILSAEKPSLMNTETAKIKATLKGFGDGETIEWYVNGTKDASLTGSEIELPLSTYTGGSEVKVLAKIGETSSKELVLSVVYDVKAKIQGSENFKYVYEHKVEDATFGGYVKVDDANGAYYQPSSGNAGNDAQFAAFNVQSFNWTMDYDFLVPESMSGEFYIYPQMQGMDTKYPTDQVELAIAVNNEKLRTYIKFHNRGLNLEETEYGTGADLTIGAGIATRGWNHCTIAVDGNYVAFYINGTMTFFANVPNTTIPSSGCMSMWFGGAEGQNVKAGFKNFKIGAEVEPPKPVAGVTISASKVSCEIGDTVTFSANVSPFDAVANVVEWYVDGVKVEGANTTTFSYTAETAGEHSIVCKIDGISSAAKTLTVNKPQKQGCKSSIGAISCLMALISICGVTLVSKKRKED